MYTRPIDELPVTGWSFDINTRTFTVGEIPCASCCYNPEHIARGRQRMFRWKTCTKCHGTGMPRNKRGKCRECAQWRDAYARAHVAGEYMPGLVCDYTSSFDAGVCKGCDGRTVVPGSSPNAHPGNAPVPRRLLDEVMPLIPVTVVFNDAKLSWGETHMGIGGMSTEDFEGDALWTSSDYGRTWDTMLAAQNEGRLAEAKQAFLSEHIADVYKSLDNTNRLGRETGKYSSTYHMIDCVLLIVRPNGWVAMRAWQRESLPV